MRIGVDARELQGHPTGVGRYLRSLLRAWPPGSGDALYLYFRGLAPALPPSPATLQARVVGAASMRGLLWQERALPAAARQDELDVFFAPGYACPSRLTLPRVTAVHDISFFNWPQDFALGEALRRRLLVGHSLAVSKRILTISEFSRREILALRPELEGRVVTTPLGPDEDLAPAPERSGARIALGLRGPLLLTVGSIFNRRRLPELMRAVACIAPRFPGLVLDVVGDNRTRPRLDLERLARELGLGGRVRLSGFVDEAALAQRYAAADVAVFLSEYEGFGLPALEAAARGVPLVVSSRPALSEIFAQAALVADPLDVGAVAAALARLLESPQLRAELATRGRSLAARHSWTEAARRTREVLEEARHA